MTIHTLRTNWQDTPEYHSSVNNDFTAKVNSIDWMNEYRTWIENNVFGFGERSFLWLWKLLVDEMPSEFTFCEIGVFRAQILGLIKMLASDTGRKVTRYGVTPLDSSGGVWESDYRVDIEKLHDTFFIPKDYKLIVGNSTDAETIESARNEYDLLYIDGSHTYEDCLSDLKNYAPMVKHGGWLVIDDACTDMSMPFGYFQGIEPVTKATLEYIDENWEFYGNVVHLRVYRRK